MPHPHNPHRSHPMVTALEGTSTPGLPQLELSRSPLIAIPSPRKPVTLGQSYTIYEGVYGPTHLKVAIKRLRVLGGDGTHTQEAKEKLDQEVSIRSSLTHENILPFYGMVEMTGELYLIYPWMEHRDLARFLTARLEHFGLPPPRDHLISVALGAAFSDFNEANTIHGIASGIAYLHAHGIVHGDLKGENILLNPSLQPLISDFGLTKSVAVDATATSMGSGAPRWTSPELINSDAPRKTEKSDVYAFGMTIVEVLTGRVPFHHLLSSFQVYKAITVDDQRPKFEPLSCNGRDFRDLWELAESCWQNNPEDRPNADDILKTLASLGQKSVENQGGEGQGEPYHPHSPGLTSEQCVMPNPSIDHSDFVSMTRRKSSVCGMPRLSLSSEHSHTVSILPPGKPLSSGSCDLFQGLYEPTGTILAMKRPRVTGNAETQFQVTRRRFSREAKIWSGLSHANLLPFYGIIELDSGAYLVYPWVEQGDLSQFLSARMEADRKSDAFLVFNETTMVHGIASGLAYLHAHSVIHGDLKPANVLLDNPINPLICDFGLTKNEGFDVTSEAIAHNESAWWTCPTVASGAPQSEKTDMFSFAMTIVEILTGHPPFRLLSEFDVQLAFTQGQRPLFEPLSSNGKNFEPLWKLAASCWEQEPSARPSAGEVERIMASLEHASEDPSDCIDHSRDPLSYNTVTSDEWRYSSSPESTRLIEKSKGSNACRRRFNLTMPTFNRCLITAILMPAAAFMILMYFTSRDHLHQTSTPTP
ncbi:hypothetical protein FRB94_011098 [Tulasnella sp. JGI-2019a]|nr:hypothetical protein FRB93_009908 [Tulasnella sp. JGI-2019a]KAG8993024.1 hypothetical protein FRB94_011098 [Tulasnella sp. JGI-2019a]